MSPDGPHDGTEATTPDRPPPEIFISYRRSDAGWAASALHQALAEHFGGDHVFIDLIDLPSGADFVEGFQRRVRACGVFLAVIGPKWAQTLRERGRLKVTDGNEDHVRVEVETALQRGAGLRLIPVLLDETPMPEPQELPRSLEGLTRIGGIAYRRTQTEADIETLIARIEELSSEKGDDDAGPSGTLGSGARPEPPEDPHYEFVAEHLVRGNVVLFLGSLVNASERSVAWADGSDSLPDGDELAAHLATEFKYGAASVHLAQVSQYVSSVRGERDLYDALRRVFTAHYTPTRVHRFFAELPSIIEGAGQRQSHQLIVTTNYDDALEHAFDSFGTPYDLAVYMATGRDRGKFVHLPWDATYVSKRDCDDWTDRQPITVTVPNRYESFPIDVVDGTVHRTTILKVHGALGSLAGDDNYVITENDYIDYLSSNEIVSLIPNQLLYKMTRSHVLFLGQQVRDWNWRVFLQRVWRERIDISWAVAPGFDGIEKRFWDKLDVDLFERTLGVYVDELRAQLLALESVVPR